MANFLAQYTALTELSQTHSHQREGLGFKKVATEIGALPNLAFLQLSVARWAQTGSPTPCSRHTYATAYPA